MRRQLIFHYFTDTSVGHGYVMAAMASAGVVKEQRIVVNEKATNISLFH